MPTAESALMEESGRVARTSASEPLSPESTASSLSAGTRKRSTEAAVVRQSSLSEARSARWPTASPTKISTGAKRAPASPARLTKTLPAGTLAAAAAAAEDDIVGERASVCRRTLEHT